MPVSVAVLLLPMTLVSAQQTSVDEKERLRQCERDLCAVILERAKDGPDIACDLSKTWEKRDIESGAEKKRLSWALGSAHCALDLKVERATLVDALKESDYTLSVPQHVVTCEVEREGSRYPITLRVAPTITFKDGQAVAASLGVSDIEAAAVIKGVIWSVSKLEETFGLFEDDITREINKFITKQCPKVTAEK